MARPGSYLDESKIIKKKPSQPVQSKVENKVEKINLNSASNNEVNIDNKENQQPNITLKEDINKVKTPKPIKPKTEVQPLKEVKKPKVTERPIMEKPKVTEKTKDVTEVVVEDSFPVFKLEQNKYTGKVESSVLKNNNSIKVNIPKDQLRMIRLNNDKYLNEVLFEISVIEHMLKSSNNNYDFYKNKLDYLRIELELINTKKLILDEML